MSTTHREPFLVPSTRPVAAELLLTEYRGLTARDCWAIDMIAEHRVLTAGQLVALGFGPTVANAARRLRILTSRGWLDRFYCRLLDDLTVETGWCLGPFGAARTHPPAEPARSPARVYRAFDRLRFHPQLDMLVATNQFFVDLASHARATAGCDLRTWWSPRTCDEVGAPGWYGEYIHQGRRVGFWFEPDPGEGAVARRVHRYRPLAARTGLGTVLFRIGDQQREEQLHEHLDRLNLTGLTVATSYPDLGHPAGLVWLTHASGGRVALHELPEAEPLGPGVPPHPIHDPRRPNDEAVADGEYSYRDVQP